MTKSFCLRLIETCEQRPEKPAMRIVGVEDSALTFGEMLDRIRSIAYRLIGEKIAFGDRVALIGENHPNWALAYLGTFYRGAVCVPLDPHGEIETITNFLENSEAKLAFLSPDQVEKFKNIQEKLGRHIPAVVWEDGLPLSRRAAKAETRAVASVPDSKPGLPPAGGGVAAASVDGVVGVATGSTNGFYSFDDWASTEFPSSFRNEIPKAVGDDTALLIYTSGTTGTPKGVPLTHGNIVAELDGINDVLKFTDKERILSLLPLFHAYLQIVNLWVATTYGCEVGYLKELSPAELGEAMKKFKPTILTTVPRLWYLFHKKIFDAVEAKSASVRLVFKSLLATNGFLRDSLNVNLGKKFFGQVHESFGGNLRLAISAGSRFDEAVALDFHKLGFTILQGYGLTETSGAATATHEEDNRVGSVGKPMTGAEIKIDNPDAEGVGEVLIRGAMVFSGYYRNAEATADAFTEDGWFRSGDLGKLDSEGHLFIVGRAKDVIVLPSGKNVHPEDLEVHYLKAPEVEELAILGVSDETESRAGAEKLIAVVVPDFEYLRQAKVANSKEAIRYALDNLGRELPEYQRVRDYIVRIEPLPRTATRKIKRFQLKKEIESGEIVGEAKEKRTWEFSADDKQLLETNSAKAVISVIKQNAPDAEVIHPQMNLEIDLGLDSLARAEVFATLEYAFSTEFDTEKAAQALTVANVIDLVRSSPHYEGEVAEGRGGSLNVDLNWSKIIKEADDDFPEIGAILRDRPLFETVAWLVYKCFNLFCRVFMRLEVRGLENLNIAKTAFLICPNHQSFLDPFVLCSNYPYRIFSETFHVGASQFFENRVMNSIAKMLNVVPVDPDTQLMKAMKAGAIGLKHGKILNIYPEGERAFDGALHEFKKGAAILATELDLPIVPVAMDGLYKVWPRRSWRIRPAKVKIHIGKPFYAEDVLSVPPAVAGGAFSGAAHNDQPLTINDPHSTNHDQIYELVTAHLKQTIADMITEMRR